MTLQISTPFSVKTPEILTPREVAEQFVDHEAYQKLTPPGHSFIEGPRGTGKSMLFRYMSPATQCIARECSISSLPFIGVIVPVKQGNVQMPEMARLSGAAARLIAENLLVTMVAIQLCRVFSEALEYSEAEDSILQGWVDDICQHIFDFISKAGYAVEAPAYEKNLQSRLNDCVTALAAVELFTQDYLDSLAFSSDQTPFTKRILNYQFFLFPLFQKLRDRNASTAQTFYILVDDADWLREEQTRVLNTWISFRTSNVISFKAACQLDYKTFLTSGTRRIEAPHDFSRVNLSTIYTQGAYKKWVESVIERRLTSFGINVKVEDFFPIDEKQQRRLLEIEKEISSVNWLGPKTDRKGDDAYRYARPELIRRLSGSAKQSSNFLYCGFNQLVDISNATIRFFLEAASDMYAQQHQANDGHDVLFISAKVQNDVVRTQATNLLQTNFDEIVKDYAFGDDGANLARRVKHVKALVDVMGSAFYASLIHPSRSERRVLAFALQTEPNDELQEILRLAVSLNFFSVSSLAKKEGFGRTRRYVINRRIAPYFNLDPSGFSGYFWVTSEFLEKAIVDPGRARDELRSRLPAIAPGAQMSLPMEDLSGQSAFLNILEAEDDETP